MDLYLGSILSILRKVLNADQLCLYLATGLSLLFVKNLGPVVQNFVSLTVSLSPQFVNNITSFKSKYTVMLPFEILTNC